MQRRSRFPPELLQLLEGKLNRRLIECVSEGAGRCLLAFVNGERFEVPPSLQTDHDWRIVLASVDQGLIGKALRTGQVETWSASDPKGPMIRGDQRTVEEFAVSINYQGQPVAVLLIDFFEGEENHLRTYKIEDWRLELERLLGSADEDHRKLANSFRAIATEVVEETASLRGFVAIIKWDGTPEYFPAGSEIEKFRYLNQLEGVCGEALATGRLVNLGDVSLSHAYTASAPEIRSEAVVPIMVDDETVGVLNMESNMLNHFGLQAEDRMRRAAISLSSLARHFRMPLGGGITLHSRLLSDLVEKFSVDNSALVELLRDGDVRSWACELCRAKVLALEGIEAAQFLNLEVLAQSPGAEIRRYRRAVDPPTAIDVSEDDDGRVRANFDMLREGVVVERLEVTFRVRPELATKEIISQFVRLTGNEIRRRVAELGAVEFEALVDSLPKLSAEQLLVRLPGHIKRMLDCDEVTYFKPETHSDGSTILYPWRSTAFSIRVSKEPFYRIAATDGLTGFASTRKEVLVIADTNSITELRSIDPDLVWKKKIREGHSPDARSFFAIPIRRASGLVGLLRGHRSMGGNRFAFSLEDVARLRRIQYLLERLFVSEDTQFGAVKTLKECTLPTSKCGPAEDVDAKAETDPAHRNS